VMRCPEWLYPDLIPLGPDFRCQRTRFHIGAHRDPNGDTWTGSRTGWRTRRAAARALRLERIIADTAPPLCMHRQHPVPPGMLAYTCSEPFGHPGDHRSVLDGQTLAVWGGVLQPCNHPGPHGIICAKVWGHPGDHGTFYTSWNRA
jgi:hypothetical protein